MVKIKFTSNNDDLSTNEGFQFEFKCERCRIGYRTSFQTYAIGKISSALDTASSLFGGLFSHASTIAIVPEAQPGKNTTSRRLSMQLQK